VSATADRELETFAQALGRTRAELELQIEQAVAPDAERRKIALKAEQVRSRIERDADATELEGFSEAAKARFEALRTLSDAEFAQRRARMTIGAQLDQALADASLLTGVKGSNTDGSGHSAGKLEGRGPGRIAGALYEPTLDVGARYRIIVGQLIANLWKEIDAVCRRPLTSERKLETSQEKETRLFRDWKGFRSEVVAALDPSLGSSRSIEMMRRRNNYRPVDGTEQPKQTKPRR
jgi:hypothetical protein